MKEVFIIQINMAEPGEWAQWEDCEGQHETVEQADAAIEWMKQEYGDTIEFRIRSVIPT